MHQSAHTAAELNPGYLKAQCMCFCVLELLFSIFRKDYFLLYLQKLEGKVQGKDSDVPCRHFSLQPGSKGKVSVFSTLAAAATSEISKGLMPWKKGPVSLHLSRGLMLMNGSPSMMAEGYA